MRKNSRKIKIKRIQKIRNVICDTCLPLLYSLFRIFSISAHELLTVCVITIIVDNFYYVSL